MKTTTTINSIGCIILSIFAIPVAVEHLYAGDRIALYVPCLVLMILGVLASVIHLVGETKKTIIKNK